MKGLLGDLTGQRSAGLIAASAPGAEPAPPAPRKVLPPVRHEPLPGDRVAWHDGTFGTVALVRAAWIDPGEALVYRHEDQAHHGAPTVLVEAGTLDAVEALPDGRHLFTYTGSLR